MDPNQFITAAQLADIMNVTARRINYLCNAGRIKGAKKVGGLWWIPKDLADPRKPIGRPPKSIYLQPTAQRTTTPKATESPGHRFTMDIQQ